MPLVLTDWRHRRFYQRGVPMPTMPPSLRPAGWRPRQEVRREIDGRRGSARARGYSTAWDKASAAFRKAHPLCEYCEAEGRATAAAIVDHLYPHRSWPGIFWERRWWVASCKHCHDGMKQAAEGAGKPALDALALRIGRIVLTPTEAARLAAREAGRTVAPTL